VAVGGPLTGARRRRAGLGESRVEDSQAKERKAGRVGGYFVEVLLVAKASAVRPTVSRKASGAGRWHERSGAQEREAHDGQADLLGDHLARRLRSGRGGAHLHQRPRVAGRHLFIAPIVVGGGKRSLPNTVRLKLELLDERRFGNGMVYLHYRTRT
jgi:hypothetical protein